MNENSDLCWVHPTNPIIEEVDSEQIIRDKNSKRQIVVGSCNFESLNKFTVKNIYEILCAFESFRLTFN